MVGAGVAIGGARGACTKFPRKSEFYLFRLSDQTAGKRQKQEIAGVEGKRREGWWRGRGDNVGWGGGDMRKKKWWGGVKWGWGKKVENFKI